MTLKYSRMNTAWEARRARWAGHTKRDRAIGLTPDVGFQLALQNMRFYARLRDYAAASFWQARAIGMAST